MIWNPWKEIKRLRAALQTQTDATDMWRKSTMLERNVTEALKTCLFVIAAQEKPTSNATVKRMARTAREGLRR